MSMTATNHTEHYGLSQYTEDDRPTYTGDYNGDMSKIDAAIYAASQTGGVSGLTEVAHTADLTGNGTAGNPLGVADTIARTEDIPSLDGYATTESVTQAIAAAIADRLTAGDIKAGNGINIETSGNQVTISYMGGDSSGGLTAVAHDTTLTGDGTSGAPLGMVAGTAVKPVDNSWNNIDFNDYYTNGIYTFNGDATNGPSASWVSGALIVLRSYQTVTQIYSATNTKMAVRHAKVPISTTNPTAEDWSAWADIASKNDIPDVSALTSRIAALESQVSALTATTSALTSGLAKKVDKTASQPGTLGLAATELDSMYKDADGIVRVGSKE